MKRMRKPSSTAARWTLALAATAGIIALPYVVRILLEKQRYPSLYLADSHYSAAGARERGPTTGLSGHEDILNYWSEKPLPVGGLDMKVDGPCVLIAKLLSGRELEATNHLLRSMRPWSQTGSEWDMREVFGWQKGYGDRFRFGHRGDYDFTETGLTSLLYLLSDQPALLYPETARHIAGKLITSKGGGVQWCVPGSFGMATETENHLLMTESIRYLTNQWLREHGDSDPALNNQTNGLEVWLSGYLELILNSGFHEYNSNPYQGFALHALLNLEAFAKSPTLAGQARQILDREAHNYALSSLRFRRAAPFRRRLEYASREIFDEPLSLMMSRWSEQREVPEKIRATALDSSFAFLASVLPYRPTAEIRQRLDPNKSRETFLRIGRGENASPEIYSSGPGFVLSAGGLAFSPLALTQTVIRPTTLLLDDRATNLTQCIRLANRGTESVTWNNTGAAPRFACGNAPVIIPESFSSLASSGNWRVFRPRPDHELFIVTYSEIELGLIALFSGWADSPNALLEAVMRVNPTKALSRCFIFPETGRVIEYNVKAPKTKWVILSDSGVVSERDFCKWPSASTEFQ